MKDDDSSPELMYYFAGIRHNQVILIRRVEANNCRCAEVLQVELVPIRDGTPDQDKDLKMHTTYG